VNVVVRARTLAIGYSGLRAGTRKLVETKTKGMKMRTRDGEERKYEAHSVAGAK